MPTSLATVQVDAWSLFAPFHLRLVWLLIEVIVDICDARRRTTVLACNGLQTFANSNRDITSLRRTERHGISKALVPCS
jgi:hypothetical protein